jgi:hypothetical protein
MLPSWVPEAAGEKNLRYISNTKHDLRNSDVRETLYAFFESVVNVKARPRFNWKFERDGSITVQTKDKPTEVKVWQATNAKARDFRLDTIGAAYKSVPLTAEKEGLYRSIFDAANDAAEPLIAEGRWHGEVIDVPRGSGGFGYDAHFLLPDFGRTAAELSAGEKHGASHRGKALRRLLALLREGG